jgi:exopolysaccharide production protein ExoZ
MVIGNTVLRNSEDLTGSGTIVADVTSRRWYPTLHVLRGVAAVSVVLLHAREWRVGRIDASYPGEQWAFHLGYGGVYLFFLLSGFLMVQVSQGGHGLRACARFAWARFARTVPTYWAVLLAVAALYAWNAQAAAMQGGIPAHYDWAYLWDNATTADVGLLPVAWTLYYEWCFYAVFALTYVLLGPWTWAAAALVWLGSMVWASAQNLTSQHIHAGIWYLSTNSFGLLLGTLLGAGAVRRPPQARPAWVFLLTLACPAAYTWWFIYSAGNGLFMEVLWPLAWAPVLWTATLWDHGRRWHYPRVALWWGAASYTIYLTHQPAMWLAFAALGHRQTPSAFIPLFAVVFGLAAAWYYAVERPLLRVLGRGGRSIATSG